MGVTTVIYGLRGVQVRQPAIIPDILVAFNGSRISEICSLALGPAQPCDRRNVVDLTVGFSHFQASLTGLWLSAQVFRNF